MTTENNKKRGVAKGTKRAQVFLCMLAVGKGKIEQMEIEAASQDDAIETFEAEHQVKPTAVAGPYRIVKGTTVKPSLFISVDGAAINFTKDAPATMLFKGWPCMARPLQGFTAKDGTVYGDGETAFITLNDSPLSDDYEGRKPRTGSTPVIQLASLESVAA